MLPLLPSILADAPVLVVDDDEVSRRMLVGMLQRHGFHHILTAGNGKEALALTQAHPPCLVLLDLIMPVMDGFQYIEAVRAEERFASMPIVVQTMMEQHEDKLRAFRIGATDFLNKPIDVDELFNRCRLHIDNFFVQQEVQEHRARQAEERVSAVEVQRRLIPSPNQLAALSSYLQIDLDACIQPGATFSGDYIYARPLGAAQLTFGLFDLPGNGATAALRMVRQHLLLKESWDYAASPGGLLTHMNAQLSMEAPLALTSAFVAVADIDAGRLDYAMAGYVPPLLLSNGAAEPLPGGGIPLGVSAQASYATLTCAFPPGSMLLAHSNALTDCPNANGQLLERMEIIRPLAAGKPPRAQEVISILREKLLLHLNGTPLRDDLAVIALRLPGA